MMEQVIAGKTSVAAKMRGVWFTFDDGPSPEYTPALLSYLDGYGVKATFFVCGKFAEQYPEIVRLTFTKGHEIGNHTWDHPDLKLSEEPEIIDQLERTNVLIESITGMRPRHFRAPYSSYNKQVIQLAKAVGLDMVGWTRMWMDWEDRAPKNIAECVLEKGISENDIIVLHDGCADILNSFDRILYTKRWSTVSATPLIIDKLNANGIIVHNPGM